MSMFLKSQMLRTIVNDALMPYIFKVIEHRFRSKTKGKNNLRFGI